jgi:hypothetical protein
MSSQAERAGEYVAGFKRETDHAQSCAWRIQRVSSESIPVLGIAFVVACKRVALSPFAVLEHLAGKWSRKLVAELVALSPDAVIEPKGEP